MSIEDLPPIDVLDEEPEFDLILMWPWEGEDDLCNQGFWRTTGVP